MLSQDDIALGRVALAQGAIQRPQLDSAVALVRGGQAPDLARALIRMGVLTPPQVDHLRTISLTASQQAALNLSGSMRGPPPGGAPGPGLAGSSPGYGQAPGLGSSSHGLSGSQRPGTMPPPGYPPPGALPPPGSFGPGGVPNALSGSAAVRTSAFGASPAALSGSAYGQHPGGYAPGGYVPTQAEAKTVADTAGARPGAFGFGAAPAPGGPPPGAPPMDERIGEWVIERELARGGMGVVYIGRRGTERAAIKVMLQSSGQISEKKLRRFKREIDANKKLVHPGIVRLLDAGDHRGYPYYAMEFVEGKPLDKMIKEDIDLEIGMEVMEGTARAAHYAHEHGVIHRDLKPGNILVTADMQAKLTDFGLAKSTDHQSVLTKTGAVLGTPYYLSPEQAAGKSKDLDRRADIYSLGVIMYEVATGRLPFVGQTTVELYNKILHEEPAPPRKVKPQLTEAFEAVCLKAMAKDPDDRYQTAEELANDIKALLGGKQAEISVKPSGSVGKAFKRLKKRGSIPAILGTTAVLLLLVVGVVVWRYRAEQRAAAQVAALADARRIRERTAEFVQHARESLGAGRAALAAARRDDAASGARGGLDDVAQARAVVEEAQGHWVPADLVPPCFVCNKRGEVMTPQVYAGPPRRVLWRCAPCTAPPEAPARTEQEQGEFIAAMSRELGQALDVLDGLRAVQADLLVLRACATMSLPEQDALDRAGADLRVVLEQLYPADRQASLAGPDLLALVGAQVASGDLAALGGTLGDALASYDRALERVASVRARAGKARVLYAQEAFEDVLRMAGEALDLLAAAAQPPPADALPREDLAEVERRGLQGELVALRGATYRELGRAEEALRDARAAAELDPAAWEPRALEASVLLAVGQRFAARELFAAAVAAAPDRPGPLLARAEGLLAMGAFGEALRDADAAVNLDPSCLAGLAIKAEAAERALRFADAEADAEAVQQRARRQHWREAGRAERVLARLAALEGDVRAAHDAAVRSRRLDEASSQGRLLLARLQLDPSFEDAYVDNAERLYREVLRQRPTCLEAHRGMGLVLLAKYARAPERAERKLEEALELDPADPWTLVALARAANGRQAADRAQRFWARATRSERDVQRPEGLAFALGLRALNARPAGAQQQAQALAAFRLATWLDPSHGQALSAMAQVALGQGNHTRTTAALQRAVEANPFSAWTRTLAALHAVTSDAVRENQARSLAAVRDALATRGETPALLVCQAFLSPFEALGPDEIQAKLELAQQRFEAVRARDPWSLESFQRERDLLTLVMTVVMGRAPPEQRERLRARLDVVRAGLTELQQQVGAREEAARLLREAAQGRLTAAPAPDAVATGLDEATRATRQAPWAADGWALLARARTAGGDALGALAAGVRAAYVDDRHVGALFGLLRAAGPAAGADPASAAVRLVEHDREALPFEADLAQVLSSTAVVSLALTRGVDAESARTAFESLERVVDREPTNLCPALLLGALAFGAGRDEWALQYLLFVATVCEEAAEARYLAAVAAARSNAAEPQRSRLDSLAIESLQAAARGGFDWRARAEQEPGLARLRGSPLWRHAEAD